MTQYDDRHNLILNAALKLFEGDLTMTQRWINHPVKGLSGKRPIDMVSTSGEIEVVLDLIGRLEHGVFS